MTTQDENTGLRPASATTPDPPVVDASSDIKGLDKGSEDGDDSNVSLNKSKSAVSMGDDAAVELPLTAELLTAEPPTEGRGDAPDILSPNKSNSVVDGKDDAIVEPLLAAEPPTDVLSPNNSNSVVDEKDDAIVEPLLATEPPVMKLDVDDDALPTVATKDDAIIEPLLAIEPPVTKLDDDDDTLSTVATKDDAIVEPLLTPEPLVTKLDDDDDALPLSKSNSAVAANIDVVVEPLLTTEPLATKLDGDDNALSPVATKDDAIVEPLLTPEPLVTKLDDDDDALPLSKSNSAVAAKHDIVIKPLLIPEPLVTKHDRDDDSRLPNKKSKLVDQQNGDEDCKSPLITELKSPVVNDFKDFIICNEVDEFDDMDECVSTYTLLITVDQDSYAAWIGTVNTPRDQVTLGQAVSCLSRIPDKAIYPPVPPGMQVVPTSDFTLDDETWLKRPLIHAYSKKDPATWTANAFLGEIKAHQLVEKHPHRNLVKFKGCLDKDGLVVGVLQKRYPMTLEFRVEAWSQPPYDATAFYNDIEAGLKHLHSLGFAHNDLNPNNVMVDAEDRLVIIDLGAAMPLGQPLLQGGTAGWNDGFGENSSVANDEIGLRLMKEYLEEHRKKE